MNRTTQFNKAFHLNRIRVLDDIKIYSIDSLEYFNWRLIDFQNKNHSSVCRKRRMSLVPNCCPGRRVRTTVSFQIGHVLPSNGCAGAVASRSLLAAHSRTHPMAPFSSLTRFSTSNYSPSPVRSPFYHIHKTIMTKKEKSKYKITKTRPNQRGRQSVTSWYRPHYAGVFRAESGSRGWTSVAVWLRPLWTPLHLTAVGSSAVICVSLQHALFFSSLSHKYIQTKRTKGAADGGWCALLAGR